MEVPVRQEAEERFPKAPLLLQLPLALPLLPQPAPLPPSLLPPLPLQALPPPAPLLPHREEAQPLLILLLQLLLQFLLKLFQKQVAISQAADKGEGRKGREGRDSP